jgi:DNA invertase Pin-like site-specific DNA recombinase
MLTLHSPESIAAYIRVSTYDQKTESQREEIARWLKNHGIDPESIQWFEDKETGKTLHRPAFLDLQRAVFDGKVKTVLVWKLDRLSRKMLDGITTMRIWLNQGVGIVSITQHLDLTGPTGLLTADILFAIAEFQLSTMKENQAAGIAAAKARGVYKGRKKGTRKLKPEKIKDLLKTLTVKQIAKLHDVTERTVYNALGKRD